MDRDGWDALNIPKWDTRNFWDNYCIFQDAAQVATLDSEDECLPVIIEWRIKKWHLPSLGSHSNTVRVDDGWAKAVAE